MIPDRCSVRESKKQCVNPPEFVISVFVDDGEYMIGVTCEKHKQVDDINLFDYDTSNEVSLRYYDFYLKF